MKIYTKGGDKGETSLLTGSRVLKSNLNIKAYGDLDELNSFIGLLIANLNAEKYKNELDTLIKIQNEIFVIGTYLAIDDFSMIKFELPQFNENLVLTLENNIDQYEQKLNPLKNFILPGGSILASHTHVCRAITRRAERHIIELIEHNKEIKPNILKFINRLSDYFFVLSRYFNASENIKDQIWLKN